MLPPKKVSVPLGKPVAITGTQTVDTSDAKRFQQEYIASPKYKERLTKQGYQNPNATVAARLQAVNNTKITYTDGKRGFFDGVADAWNGRDYKESNARNPGEVVVHAGDVDKTSPAQAVAVHELSHKSFTRPDRTYGAAQTAATDLNAADQQALEKPNNSYKSVFGRTYDPAYSSKAFAPHDAKAEEAKGDMDGLRYQLQRAGIYKAGQQDFTQQHLEKAKTQLPENFLLKRLQKNYGDADLLKIMNTVASTAPTPSLPMAKKGIKSVRLPKAVNGLQKIRADQAGGNALATSLVSTGAEALLPGVGGAVIGGLNAGSAMLKDKDGLYNSRFAQALDAWNPVTQVTRVGTGLSKAFQGDFKGALGAIGGDQQELKDAIAQQKKDELQQQNWARVGVDTLGQSQTSQYKMGSKQVKTKAIEMEGGEPHFSKPVGGQRTLKQYHPHGPKHSQGGIPAIAAEGDAIVTAKGGKGAQAVAAHQRGDHRAVEKIIQQMPADKPLKKPKAARGLKDIRFTPGVTDPDALLGDGGLQRNAAIDNLNQLSPRRAQISLTNAAATPAPAKSGLLGNALNGLQGAASAYNLGQGLFGHVEQTKRRTYSPALQQYADLSAPQRAASQQAMNGQVANARNLSAGSAGNVRANANQAFADNAQRQGQIDAQESGRKLAVGNENVQARNQAQLQNNAMNNQADEYDLQNQAKKTEALGKGMEGFAALAGQSVLQKNTLAKEAQDRNMLGQAYRNYGVDKDMNIKLRAKLTAAGLDPDAVKKKGSRFIKVKG